MLPIIRYLFCWKKQKIKVNVPQPAAQLPLAGLLIEHDMFELCMSDSVLIAVIPHLRTCPMDVFRENLLQMTRSRTKWNDEVLEKAKHEAKKQQGFGAQ